jgi:CheY-like chemotaxis protein
MFDPLQPDGVVDAVSPRPARSRKQKFENGKSNRKKIAVLVVDDERLIADTMTEILKRSGFHAACAYDGESALVLALQLNPDFVVSDVVMPHMNGVQLAIAIRKALPTAEIILLSGQVGVTEILERGRKDGYSFELIAKPVHPEKLLQRLKRT